MAKIVEGDLPDFRDVYGILKDLTNDLNGQIDEQEITPDPIDCINDFGQHQGEIAGRAAIETQFAGGTPEPMDPMQGYDNATEVCAPNGIAEHYAEPQSIPLPEIVTPFLTGLQVALTPTELNAGEKGWIAEQNAPSGYQEHFADGYLQGQIDGFDAHLEQRFAPPEPEPIAAAPIDSVIPPLTADPHVIGNSWSGGNDYGGSSGSNGSSGGSDGSSSSSN
jgi:hypothetical protein